MNEFGITKIMDGIFISDLSLIYDQQFLIQNKVSHLILWTSQDVHFNEDDSPIRILRCNKSSIDGLLPYKNEINNVFECIEESKDQCMCTLICSDFQSQAGMLLSTYILKKFNWDLKTVFSFITMRFQYFEPRVEIVEQLQDFQLELQMYHQRQSPSFLNQGLKSLQFNYQFLSSYQTDNYEEKLLINTIKNMTSDKNTKESPKNNKIKRRKKLQWFDKLRPSSSLSLINHKYNTYPRNSSLKPKARPSIQQSIKAYPSSFESKRSLKPEKNGAQVKYKEFITDELELQSLKQLTRPKSGDQSLIRTLRKVNSLKLVRPPNNLQKENRRNRIIKIYGKEQQFRNSQTKIIFGNLKKMNRLKLGVSA